MLNVIKAKGSPVKRVCVSLLFFMAGFLLQRDILKSKNCFLPEQNMILFW